MDRPLHIWLETSHHLAFRVGGWAWVRADGALVTGHAGGERRIDAECAALAGLAAALREAKGYGPIRLHTASELIAAIPGRIRAAQAGEDAPAANLELWAQLSAALAATPVQMVRSELAPRTPSAFAAAWAELARDKAKDRGPFTSPIPKSNLAKAGVA